MNTATTRAPAMTTTMAANTTSRTFQPKPNLYDFHNTLNHFLLVGVMFVMSCGLDKELIMQQLKRPLKIVLAMVCQCLLFPLVVFGIMMLVDFPDNIKVGAIITASVPTGVYSNIWTHWSRGDLALSVIVTTLSVTFSIIFIPLNVSVYTLAWVSEGHVIPFAAIGVAIAETWLAVGAGLLCHYHLPDFSRKAVSNGSMVFFLLLLLDTLVVNICYPNLFALGPAIILTILAMPMVAFGLGLLVCAPFYRWMNIHQMKTIGFDTGTKNMALAFQLINLTYNRTPQTIIQYSAFSIVYTPFQLVDYALIARFSFMYFLCKVGEHPCQKKCCCSCCRRNMVKPDVTSEKHGSAMVELEEGDMSHSSDTLDTQVKVDPSQHDTSNGGQVNGALLTQ